MALTKVTERIISDNLSISGIATASNFKTGTTNVHNVGVEVAGINVLGGDTPIGTGSTIWKDGGALFSGIVTATSFVGDIAGNVTGNISGGTVAGSTGTFSSDVTISGDLGVAGTLTYEDVARVDAIGLSTYREGLHIGPLAGIALTAYKDGSIRTTGVITATTYYGSGANLTGIDATQIVTGNTSVQTVDTGSNGHVKVTTEGSERLRITSNGKVYIGPYQADFSDAGTFLNLSNDSYGGRIGFRNNTGNAGVALMEQFAYWGNNKIAGIIATAGTDTSNKDDGYLRFYTRPSGGAVKENLRITSTGVVHHSNAADELTWSRQTGRATQGNGNSTTYSVKTFYYGVATFKIALSDGNSKWAHLVVEIGGMQYTAGNGYNATVVANSTGNGPSISLNKQDGGYHITITNGGNSNTLFGSWVLEGTSYTDGSTPTLVIS